MDICVLDRLTEATVVMSRAFQPLTAHLLVMFHCQLFMSDFLKSKLDGSWDPLFTLTEMIGFFDVAYFVGICFVGWM